MKGFGHKALGFDKETLVGKYGEPWYKCPVSWHVNTELSKKIKGKKRKGVTA